MSDKNIESTTKAVLADKIIDVIPSMTARKSSEIVESILSEIRDCLVKGDEVKISGFGKFVIHEKKARKGRNPQTGESITISDRRVLKFKVSEKLKADLNGEISNEE